MRIIMKNLPNSENITTTKSNSLIDKLFLSIMKLLQTSIELREALTNRSAEQIWQTLAKQEEQAALLEEYSNLWNQLQEVKSFMNNADDKILREKIQQNLQKLRSMQRSNALLAQSFLSAVRKALSSGNRNKRHSSQIYNRRGRKSRRASSNIINRQG